MIISSLKCQRYPFKWHSSWCKRLAGKMQLLSPQLECLWRHELQRVRRPVKVDYIELHRWVGLTSLHAEPTVQSLDRNVTSLLQKNTLCNTLQSGNCDL